MMNTHTLVDVVADGKRFLHTTSLPEGGGFGKDTFTIDDVEVDQAQWQRQLEASQKQDAIEQ
jgi:hypothetical protein